tara:strand:- start:31 stop:462 length:432 start_codon:yes stop_codon:yes gene_type:complete
VSFGLNGALLHSNDALAYAAYLEKHITRRPPDHMLVEWFAGEKPERCGTIVALAAGVAARPTLRVCMCVCVCCGVRSKAYKGDRPHIAFRHNLLEHLGDISSLRSDKTPVYAACYEQLLDPVLFEVCCGVHRRACGGQCGAYG